MRRLAVVAGLTVVLWAVTATPSAADSAGPSNYLSEVTEITPAADGVEVRVAGGDSFLVVAADEGTDLRVPGYEGEPYVHIDPGGDVFVNRNSPAYWINQDRFAQVPLPPSASAEAGPDWQLVSDSGEYGWHDHRIHWMSPQPPPAVDRSQRSLVLEWTVPLAVGDEPVSVEGHLWWLPPVSPVPWLLGVAVVGLVVVWRWAASWGLMAASALALSVGIAQTAASPLGMGAEALAWVAPAVAVGAAVGAVVAKGANRSRLLAFGGVVLAVWAIVRVSSLWMPVLPTELPVTLERAAVAAALAGAGAALVEGSRRLLGGGFAGTDGG
ncbi:MAG TPA: hypothetical protein VJ938_05870 [Acidimicrobiia bacterium]|nr:hypothetical protein [Acidimicrobiia bacterium]